MTSAVRQVRWGFVALLALAAPVAVAPVRAARPPVAKPPAAPGFAGMIVPLAGGGGAALDLAAGTEITLTLATPLDVASAVGDRVAFTLARDTVIEGIVVIPAGAAAHGRVTQRSGSGTRRDPVDIAVELVALDVRGTSAPLRGGFRLRTIVKYDEGYEVWPLGTPTTDTAASARHLATLVGAEFASLLEPPLRFVLPVFTARSAPDPSKPLAVRVALQTVRAVVASGLVPVRQADTPSGYCYDVPRNYAGTGSVRAPTTGRLAPACWQIGVGSR